MNTEEAQALLYQALATERGLLLLCSDAGKLQQKLHQARVKCGDPSLSVLQFRAWPSPDEAQLAIYRPQVAKPPQQQKRLADGSAQGSALAELESLLGDS